MSLPTSEPLPTHINQLPPSRQRHIRRHPSAASPAERGLLLESLLDLSHPSLKYFLLSLLGAVIFGSALYFNEPVALFLGLVVSPFFKPLFGLALFPHSHKFSHWIKSLISLLIPFVFNLIAGGIAGYLQKSGQLNRLDAIRFSQLYWLDLFAVVAGTFFCVFILIRKGKLPQKIGVILSLEILFPFSLAGFGLLLGFSRIWPDVLLIGFCHLFLAIFIAIISFLILGFGPKRITGWIFALLPLVLGSFLFATTFIIDDLQIVHFPESSPTAIPIDKGTEAPTKTDSPTRTEEIIPSSTNTSIIQTSTATPTIKASPTIIPSLTLTPTSQPTTFIVSINSTLGVVIRETPDFQSLVIGYGNNGDQYEVFEQVYSENGSLWYKIQISTGESGWLLGSLASTQTPAPSETN